MKYNKVFPFAKEIYILVGLVVLSPASIIKLEMRKFYLIKYFLIISTIIVIG